MAGSLPNIQGGSQPAQYPLTRTREHQTRIYQFINGTEQRYKTRAPFNNFEVPLQSLLSADVTGETNFFNSQKGMFDKTSSIAIGCGTPTTYSNMALQDDVLNIRQGQPRQWDLTIRMRQTQNRNITPPSVSAVYPTLAAGVVAMLPNERNIRFSTQRNDMESGQRYAWSWYGAGLTGFPTRGLRFWLLSYPIITDADTSTLETFFAGMEGSYQTFSFTDPWDSTVYTKCRFGSDVFPIKFIAKGINTVGPLPIVEFN